MKITQTKDIRTANRWEIIRQVLHNYPISRVDICNLTGLNKATVSTIVKEWIDAGLLKETEHGTSATGRRPILLEPLLNAGCVIALDIDIRSVRAIHGIVDLSGLIRFVPSLGWRNIDICTLLKERYHVPICIDNDGNLAAIAQQNIEMNTFDFKKEEPLAQPPYQSLAVVNISDSISAGLITNGELLRGYHGFANAIGHHTINFDEPVQCHCGKYGCWEQYCSDSAVIAQANALLETPIHSIHEFTGLIQHQNPEAKKVLDRFLTNLAVGLTNIIFIFDCEAIAISSELLSSLPYYLPEVLRRMILPITHSEQVVLSRLGKNGAILGAANQAIEHFFQELSNLEPSLSQSL